MTKGAFVARFRAVARDRVTKVLSALDAGDASEARREMHGLKGEARVVGFEHVARLAHALEGLLAEGAPRSRLDQGVLLVERALELDPDIEPPGVGAFLEHDAAPAEPSKALPDEPLSWLASRAEDSFLRVDMALLGRLTRSISEVRATERSLRSLTAELVDLLSDDERERAHHILSLARQIAFDHRQRCDTVTDDLRRLRMVPLGQLLEPFPRAAAQLARQLGKAVDVVVLGADVEVDRQVLDLIAEPLLHLVRNAIDHGIEAPDVRRELGKHEVGRLILRARAAGAVRLEIEDDGAGIDEDAVRASANVGELDGPDALLEVLCRHGMTTRTQVSEVSGRGVGLDVVKRRVESVGGQLLLSTERGRGTTFTLELPSSMVLGTMAIVEVDGARYALSPHEVSEVVDAREISRERAGGGFVVRVGGHAVPLFDLGALTERSREARDRPHVLVLRHLDRTIALSIDAFRGTRAISEQRLDPFLQELEIVRSVAVLASGELAVALDPSELLRRADAFLGHETGTPTAERELPRGRVLVVDDSELTRDLIVATLRDMGLEVIEAVDGAGALAHLEAEEVGLIVTDLDMPVLDGFELIRRVRHSRRARLPIIVLSTRGDDADVRRASELGADAYLVKSRLEIEHLRRVVRRYVGANG